MRDRGCRAYVADVRLAIPSLRDDLLVDQYAIGVEHRCLEGREWRSRTHRSREDVVSLIGVPVTVSLASIYELVDL